ncbi:MAG: hypothetical protein ACRDL7_05685, partial [Gaiellaceae bacterium]
IWSRLGVLTALIISASALATLTIIPSLALLVKPRFLARAPASAPQGAADSQPVAVREAG